MGAYKLRNPRELYKQNQENYFYWKDFIIILFP